LKITTDTCSSLFSLLRAGWRHQGRDADAPAGGGLHSGPDALPDLTELLEAFGKTTSEKYQEDLRLFGGLLLRAVKAADAFAFLERARNDESGVP
jgi:hypothetical protein